MKKQEWFESWFDTSYYHTLYSKRDENEAKEFIVNLVEFLKIDPKSKVLDLACGKGRHSLTLNELGLFFNEKTSNALAKNYWESKFKSSVWCSRCIV